jgi:hypothetical protein
VYLVVIRLFREKFRENRVNLSEEFSKSTTLPYRQHTTTHTDIPPIPQYPGGLWASVDTFTTGYHMHSRAGLLVDDKLNKYS